MTLHVTLLDGIQQTYANDEVAEISRSMGDVKLLWDHCGEHPIFGHIYCPDCKPLQQHCGKQFIAAVIRGEPELPVLQLKNGMTLQILDWRRE